MTSVCSNKGLAKLSPRQNEVTEEPLGSSVPFCNNLIPKDPKDQKGFWLVCINFRNKHPLHIFNWVKIRRFLRPWQDRYPLTLQELHCCSSSVSCGTILHQLHTTISLKKRNKYWSQNFILVAYRC